MAKKDASEGTGTRGTGRKRGAPAGSGEGAAGAGATAKKTGGRKTAARKRAGGGAAMGGGPDLRTDLREFISSRPHGWGHDDWTGLLGSLGERGHDVSDPDRVGRDLERERLASVLEGVEGLSSRAAQALADRFGTLWSFRHASLDEVASVKGVSRAAAERARQHVS